jgi:hypothetical protein
MSKRIMLTLRGITDSCYTRVEQLSKEEVVDHYKKYDEKLFPLVKDHPFKTLKEVSCYEADDDTIVKVWGYDTPSIDFFDYGDHFGVYLELDGKVMYNTMKPNTHDASEEEVAEVHEDCDICAKPVA